MTLPKEIRNALGAPKSSEALREINELRAMTVPELVVRYESVWGKPPRSKHKAFLWKRIAWKLEEARTGGLSTRAKARLEELMAEIKIDFENRSRTVSGALTKTAARHRLSPGTTLIRQWRGQQISVRVLETGQLDWNGALYGSLTAVAKAVTGSHWNGRLFFGLTKGKEAAA